MDDEPIAVKKVVEVPIIIEKEVPIVVEKEVPELKELVVPV